MDIDATRPVRLAILGTGNRGGDVYGGWALRHPDRARIVAVADPRHERRDRLAHAAGVVAADRFDDWRDLIAAAGRLQLDAVIVALPDREHVEPALAAAELGVDILLEKPAASTPEDLERISARARRLGARIFVGHVLRYTPFWQTVRQIVASGAIGRLLTIRHEENIGFWHFAHSFVRGNWRRADTSSPMVLAKTCHDLDLIHWLADAAPRTVASSGALTVFRPENAPPGAPQRCLDGCPAAESCAFYAPRFYVDALAGSDRWPITVLTTDPSPEGRLDALRTGPYGRCVYRCDNDVADHQQTVMNFADGLTATLSTSGLTGQNTRTVQLTGAAGELTGHMGSGRIVVDLFAPTAQLPPLPLARDLREDVRPPALQRTIELIAAPPDDHAGHGGGDAALMEAFVTGVATGTLGEAHGASLEHALDSHRMAFAAEESRLTGATVTLATPTVSDAATR